MCSAYLVVLVGVVGMVLGGHPQVIPTVGQVWPQPQTQHSTDAYMVIRPDTFSFKVLAPTCDILDEAVKRYMAIMFPSSISQNPQKQPWSKSGKFRGYLDHLTVSLMKPCEERPYLHMDEQYLLKVDAPDIPGNASLVAQSVWGILRGLETFSQLLVPSGAAFSINATQIMDFPRFSYRGMMIDTSRHYLPVQKIYETLDLMAMNKYNVLHWHLVDDPSFPYVSAAFPDLSAQGAYSPKHIYPADVVASVIEYGRMRGIRVLSEFDTPGHTLSWAAQPGLLTPCYQGSSPDGTFGPIDPTNNANYNFLKTFFQEVTQTFPDHYVHLGGDEVSFNCWRSNPNITQFMAQHNISGNYAKLEEFYITKLLDIIKSLPTKNGYMVWQEVFDNGVNISEDTLVHIWKGNALQYKLSLYQITAKGYNAILSSCWYLNEISYGVDWAKYYQCDPQDFGGSESQKKLVLGGEACMWGEFVDRTNLISRTWPRASVVAEKLWSPAAKTNDTNAASPRLEEHRCRLLDRGYGVEPIRPSFCLSDVL